MMTLPLGLFSAAGNENPLALNTADAIERMGDRDIYLEIAHFFAEHLPDSLAQLQQALEEGNLTEARRLSHSLKGNCATVGADKLRELCYTLERLCRDGELEMAKNLFEQLAPQLQSLREILLSL